MIIKKLPSIKGDFLWINSPLADKDLYGSHVLVHFFSLSCSLCHKMVPMVIQWHNNFNKMGFKCMGVHHVKSLADEDFNEVKKFVKACNIPYPVAFDLNNNLSKNFNNFSVPSFYLFDINGRLKHYMTGEKGVDFLKIAVEKCFTKSGKY